MQVYNKPVFSISSLPLRMNTTITSSALQLANMFGYSVQIVFTGTPTGSFKLQGSDDPVKLVDPNYPASPAPTHWSDIADSSKSVVAAGDVNWNVSDVFYNWVRIVYADGSSGASTAVITSAVFNGKGV